MKIQLPAAGLTGNNKFIVGHLYQHSSSDQIYLCADHADGLTHGRYLIALEKGLAYPIQVSPQYYVDITNQVSLQEIKK